jgi:hypothetical protein
LGARLNQDVLALTIELRREYAFFVDGEKSRVWGLAPHVCGTSMHLIAHRGWSAGGDENSLAAFARAARDEAVTGVEFDVSRAADSGAGAVAHDPPLYTENALTLDAALSFLARTDLELFVELKEQGLASSVIEKLVSNRLADRSVVFAFAAEARSFPWEGARPVRLGVIVMCPWNLHRIVRLYAPDVLLRLGRAQLDADCVSRVVVFFLPRTSRAASPATSCSGGRPTHEGH